MVYIGGLARERGTKEMVEGAGRCDPDMGIHLVLAGRAGKGELDAAERLGGCDHTLALLSIHY